MQIGAFYFLIYLFNDLTFRASSTQLTQKPVSGRFLDILLELDLAKPCGSLPRGGGVSILRDTQSSAGLWTLEVGLAASRGPPSINVSVIPVVVVTFYSGRLSCARTVHADVILRMRNANQNIYLTMPLRKIWNYFCFCTAGESCALQSWWYCWRRRSAGGTGMKVAFPLLNYLSLCCFHPWSKMKAIQHRRWTVLHRRFYTVIFIVSVVKTANTDTKPWQQIPDFYFQKHLYITFVILWFFRII